MEGGVLGVFVPGECQGQRTPEVESKVPETLVRDVGPVLTGVLRDSVGGGVVGGWRFR